MNSQTKVRAKRWFGFLMAALLVVNLLPGAVFADGTPAEYSRVTNAGGTRYYDANGDLMANANDNSDFSVKISKEAEKVAGTEDEFEITLKVTPKEISEETSVDVGADIVLVFDVSTSMDWTVSGTTPGSTGWKLADTRWTALKAAANTFIDEMLGNGNPHGNRISIVVYGGSNQSGHSANSNHKTLADWSDNPDTLKNAYNKYETVSESTRNAERYWEWFTWVYPNWDSLRKATFNDSNTNYGATNSQAGFRGANVLLDSAQDDAYQYVIYMSDGVANRHYNNSDNKPVNSGNDNNSTSVSHAISETTKLATDHSEATIYTIGFGSGSANSRVLNPEGTNGNKKVDAYFPANDAASLEIIYSAIGEQIHRSLPGLVVDPMGANVNLVEGSLPATQASYTSRTINWDLDKDTAVNGTYTLQYRVKPDTSTQAKLQGWYDDSEQPTNGKTTLTYSVKVDDSVSGSYTVEFPVPEIEVLVRKVNYTYINAKPEGAESAPGLFYILHGKAIGTKPLRSFEGWTFDGWYTDPALTDEYNFASAVTGDFPLYGEWEKVAVTTTEATTATEATTTVTEATTTATEATTTVTEATTTVTEATTTVTEATTTATEATTTVTEATTTATEATTTATEATTAATTTAAPTDTTASTPPETTASTPPPVSRYFVQVRYREDGTNATLRDSVYLSTILLNGEGYNASALADAEIDGYTKVRTEGALTGTISGSNVVITVYYDKVAETTAPEPPPETTPPETEDITDTTPPLDPPETTTPPETDAPATSTDDEDVDGGVIIVDPEIPTDLPETGVSVNHLGNLLLSLIVGFLITLAAVLDLRRKAR